MKLLIDKVRLSTGHSLILGHKPEKLQLNDVCSFIEEHPQDIARLGLFDNSSPNYATYYPEVTEEDLSPKDSDFIEPVYRALSNVIVHPNRNPIYFPSDILKQNIYKLIGQTINIDHEMAVGNAIGTVSAVEWQNSYQAKGLKVPAGINAVLKIDGKSNPRIARGIMMSPPSIHSTSVTVSFGWEKSHSKMSDEEFWGKLGTFDEKGKLVHRIVNDIVAFHEISLVSHGADPFAQKIGADGKIVNPGYGKIMDRGLTKNFVANSERSNYYYWDWKSFKVYPEDSTIPINLININNNQMEELLRFLETYFGFDADSLTAENVQESVGKINFQTLSAKALKADEPVKVLDLEGLENIEQAITELRSFKETVPKDLTEKINLSETGKVVIEELRADAERLYGLSVEEGKQDATILALIKSADYKTLKSLHKQYDELTEKKFGFECTDCGSHSVARASAQSGDGNGGGGKSHTKIKSNSEVMDKFTDGVKKNRYLSDEG